MKKWMIDEIDAKSATEIKLNFTILPLDIISMETILDAVWVIAERYRRSFYDSLYLATAQTQECRLVTADKKFYNAMKSTPVSKSLLR